MSEKPDMGHGLSQRLVETNKGIWVPAKCEESRSLYFVPGGQTIVAERWSFAEDEPTFIALRVLSGEQESRVR